MSSQPTLASGPRFYPCLSLGLVLASGWMALSPQRSWAQRLPEPNRSSPQAQIAPVAPGICPAQLDAAIARIVDREPFERSRWGVLVETLNSSNPVRLYARDPEHYFVPASNAKLLTTAAALTQFGPDFRLRTTVYGVGTAPNLSVLRIVGQGDPHFSEADLERLAQQLRQQGIRQVQQLVIDDSYFQGDPVNPTWEWEDVQAAYGAPVTSVILNQNAIDLKLWPQALGQPLRVEWSEAAEAQQWRLENTSRTVATTAPEFVAVGRDLHQPLLRVSGQLRVGAPPEPVAVPVTNPVERFGQRFRRALMAQQINVLQTVVVAQPQPMQGQELAAIASPPLATLLETTNQESNNLYAEVLLRTLGAKQTPPATSTAAAGLAQLKTTLTGLGVHPQSYLLVDGSGLSRQNLVSPAALVQTLQAMARSPHAAVYQASLPIAGTNGTLSDRLVKTPAQGQLRAKTGTLTGVAALSGYLQPPQYAPLVFSILVNHTEQPQAELRRAIDEIVLLLTRLQPCPPLREGVSPSD